MHIQWIAFIIHSWSLPYEWNYNYETEEWACKSERPHVIASMHLVGSESIYHSRFSILAITLLPKMRRRRSCAYNTGVGRSAFIRLIHMLATKGVCHTQWLADAYKRIRITRKYSEFYGKKQNPSSHHLEELLHNSKPTINAIHLKWRLDKCLQFNFNSAKLAYNMFELRKAVHKMGIHLWYISTFICFSCVDISGRIAKFHLSLNYLRHKFTFPQRYDLCTQCVCTFTHFSVRIPWNSFINWTKRERTRTALHLIHRLFFISFEYLSHYWIALHLMCNRVIWTLELFAMAFDVWW